MNREMFERLLAEALGNELSSANLAAFEACLADHPEWQHEYRAAIKTLRVLAELDAPRQVEVRRSGDTLVIAPQQGSRHPTATVARSNPLGGWHRYAAVILIAFTAGYALHGALLVKEAARPPQAFVAGKPQDHTTPIATPNRKAESRHVESFRDAVIHAHRRKPSRSGLATCLIAMAKSH